MEDPDPMKLVMLTGAAGGVGRFLRPLLREHYRLLLVDRVPIGHLEEGERSVVCDVCERVALEPLMRSVDVVVHLAGVSVEDDWQPILEANITGCYNTYESARQAGVARFIFASSNHAVGFYPRARTIDTDVTVLPDSRYGVSKAFGEALGALYAHKYGMGVLCIRIGNVATAPIDVRRLAIWISPRDLAQLVRIGIDHPDLGYEIVYGMSDNKRAWWDNAGALRLGYRPQDRSEDYAADVLANAAPPTGAPGDRLQGGPFVSAESGGDPSKPPLS